MTTKKQQAQEHDALSYPTDLPSLEGLKGQKLVIAEALVKYGYVSKEYALEVFKVRNVHEVVARLRKLGWPIATKENMHSKLYTLEFDRRAYVRKMGFGIAVAAMHGDTATVKHNCTCITKLLRHVGL